MDSFQRRSFAQRPCDKNTHAPRTLQGSTSCTTSTAVVDKLDWFRGFGPGPQPQRYTYSMYSMHNHIFRGGFVPELNGPQPANAEVVGKFSLLQQRLFCRCHKEQAGLGRGLRAAKKRQISRYRVGERPSVSFSDACELEVSVPFSSIVVTKFPWLQSF